MILVRKSCRSISIAVGLSLLAAGSAAGSDAPVVAADEPLGVLARQVPAHTRFFLEVQDGARLEHTPAGSAMGQVLGWLMAQVKSPGEELTGADGPVQWRQMLSRAIGLPEPRSAELLFSGRLALAGDDWNHLAEAVLLAVPARLADLERALLDRREPGDDGPLRRYRLDRGHILCTDGRLVVVGQPGGPDTYYSQTVALLGSTHGVSLADLVEYRERLAEVSPGSHLLVYLGTNRRGDAGAGPADAVNGSIWSPPIRSAAIGATFTAQGLVIDVTGRLAGAGQPLAGHDPPIDALLFLPASTVVAWTYPVNYSAEFRRWQQAGAGQPVGFYLELMQWGLQPGELQSNLLDHLIGDTVLLAGYVPVQPDQAAQDEPAVWMPTFGLAVKTDAPEQVDRTLTRLAGNLLRLVNVPAVSSERERIRQDKIFAPGAFVPDETFPLLEAARETGRPLGTVKWAALGRLWPAGAAREMLGETALSWCVHEGWLVVATHPQTVREMVLAREGEAPLIPADAVQQAMRRGRPPSRLPDMVLIAQPGTAGQMIGTWLDYLDRHHRQMMTTAWWRTLRRKYLASQVQLGVMPGPIGADGTVAVEQTMPGWPADGRLLPADRISAVDGRPLDPRTPLASLRDLLVERERDEQVRLTVLRAGASLDITLPMPVAATPAAEVHPLMLLREVGKLARSFEFASYATWQPSRDQIQTRLELRMAETPDSAIAATPQAD